MPSVNIVRKAEVYKIYIAKICKENNNVHRIFVIITINKFSYKLNV